ncbi:MAG TPA: NAD(P)H-hydrate epimerase [Tepidisphaeraceae bacterium]|jgi:NAD(P)H-hydrate epimerase|nr:NAD(P)H-hydrate epimerase [Tepidisphaeraceae bacterium]
MTTPPLRLSRAQVREVDRLSIEEYRIPGIVLMENAARGATDVASAMLRHAASPHALILCGGGNNGGDGLAIARHLHSRGVRVTIALSVDPAAYKGDAFINWQIVQAMALPARPASTDLIASTPTDLIIDAIFGTGLTSAPRGDAGEIINAVIDSNRPILSIDLPSGLDCDTGLPLGPCIRATQTVTFVGEKAGFAHAHAKPWLGNITIADIGCPPEAITRALATMP